jgi:hypothetical protein
MAKIILPPEKPNNTIEHTIVPFRRVLDGILYVLRTGVSEMEGLAGRPVNISCDINSIITSGVISPRSFL